MAKTSIEWATDVWNPVVGCTRKSPGCDHCYAFALHDKRHVAWKRGRWNDAPAQYHKPFSQVQLIPERLEQPLHWREPRRVFVNSVSDVFHDAVPDEFILKMFTIMRRAKQHTFQILTKRPERMLEFMTHLAWRSPTEEEDRKGGLWGYGWQAYLGDPGSKPTPNIWIGVTCENQDTANERIPLLIETPAAVRFLSCEPLLSAIDITIGKGEGWLRREHGTVLDGWTEPLLHWCIVGCESGKGARPMDINWVRSIRDQCTNAGVKFFYKQDADTSLPELDGEVWAQYPEVQAS